LVERAFSPAQIRKQEELTLAYGLLLNVLHVNCGVAKEKMALAIATVCTSLFQKILSLEVLEKLIHSSRTYDGCMEKTSAAMEMELIEWIDKDVLALSLMLDASEKNKKDWTLKVFNALLKNSAIQSGAFSSKYE
jgi:hypothetical protein